ncbi:hypothetical protein GTW25_00140 [Aliihoeflea aestuarii]|uniref:hypothetical protein n=1 Tax=Aliihoeflea aestuarii TaxID=453840 RepID=UPI0020928C82|nr:hypothetical protein [Aliihoeflea aestuarii]MCO6389439.1 hypothetical protein [Aliihoeflea aestuarii]
MELKDFVSQSIREIIAGIVEAQSADQGDLVNANSLSAASGGNLFNAGTHGVFTRIDFDVAVTAEVSGSAGAGLKVFGLGAEAAADRKHTGANRLTFSVPVRLPDGDATKGEEVKRRSAERRAQLLRDSAPTPIGLR